MNQLTYNAINSQLTKIKSDIRALLHQQLYYISPAILLTLPTFDQPDGGLYYETARFARQPSSSVRFIPIFP